MIHRRSLMSQVVSSLRRGPVTAILGPRQCGKTTLARQIARQKDGAFFDLENPADLARLQNPLLALQDLHGLVVLDEVQRKPDLLPVLRVLSDRQPPRCRFLILGSASPELIRGASESLAGRVRTIDMTGFLLGEVGVRRAQELWSRGAFPRSFLATSDAESFLWRSDFIRTFLERDLRLLGINLEAETTRRFWTMIAHYHGQIWNASEIGSSLGVSYHTARRYLDLLCGAYVVRQLQPWFENAGKRIVKSPKVYVRDSGLLHTLLQIPDLHALAAHPKLGASWEGFAIEQVLALVGERNAYFWSTQGGAELDLFILKDGRRLGVE
ncbi:MAG TPA: ATP-binding protein, partial [Tepidisphaeraceae bacterium]|nr:ATP-binding protein [Tepidisphaeraceae bacterium]